MDIRAGGPLPHYLTKHGQEEAIAGLVATERRAPQDSPVPQGL